MVIYTLDNIEGVIFKYSGEIYKIHKETNQMEYLNKSIKNKFFNYNSWKDCVVYLNTNVYKVESQPEKIIEVW